MSTSPNGQVRQPGFTLFPTPPTPPAQINGASYRSRAVSRRQDSVGTLPSLSENSELVIDRIGEQQLGGYVPPVPPLSVARSTILKPQHSHHTLVSGGPNDGFIRQSHLWPSNKKKPAKVPTSNEKPRTLRALFPWTLNKRGDQHELHDKIGSESGSTWRVRKKSIGQLSQMFDTEIGKVDQRKLSTYLGNILDTSFKTPDLLDVLDPKLDLKHIQHPQQTRSKDINPRNMRAHHIPTTRLDIIADNDCMCHPATVICQCSSSMEFRTFQHTRDDHKQQASISSTACLLGVPRARFMPVIPRTETPRKTEDTLVSSPPGLSFSYSSSGSRTTEESSWSTPESPASQDDPFALDMLEPNRFWGLESRAARRTRVPSKKESMRSKRVSDSQSFSRPFIAGRPPSIAYPKQKGSRTPPSSRSSTSSAYHDNLTQHNFLGNRDTMSTFNFELEPPKTPQRSNEANLKYENPCTPQRLEPEQKQTRESPRRRMIAKSCEPAVAKNPHWSWGSVQSHRHKRSNSSTCSSAYEVIESTKTATVSTARTAKAVVVMHSPTQRSSPESTPPPPPSAVKSAYWKRIEKEQQEQLKKLQRARQQQYLPQQMSKSRSRTSTLTVRSSFRRSTYSRPRTTPTSTLSVNRISDDNDNDDDIFKDDKNMTSPTLPVSPVVPQPIFYYNESQEQAYHHQLQQQQQQRQQEGERKYSRRIILGPPSAKGSDQGDEDEENNYRTRTTDGSPVTGRARLTIVC